MKIIKHILISALSCTAVGLYVFPAYAADVSSNDVKRSVKALAAWFVNNQDDVFVPDRFDDAGTPASSRNYTRLLQATWLSLELTNVYTDTAFRGVALKGLSSVKQFLRCHPEQGVYFVDLDGSPSAGDTALMILALLSAGEEPRRDEYLKNLIAGLLGLQLDTGQFRAEFFALDSNELTKQPGLVLLALARSALQTKDEQTSAALNKGLGYYANPRVFKRTPSHAAYLALSAAEAYELTKKSRYRTLVYELSDYLLTFQQTKLQNTSEKFIGMFGRSDGGVSSGLYLGAIRKAYSIARSNADSKRKRRYGSSLNTGLKFLFSLQIDDDGAPFPQASGSFERFLGEGTVRLDYNFYAMLGLHAGLEVSL